MEADDAELSPQPAASIQPPVSPVVWWIPFAALQAVGFVICNVIIHLGPDLGSEAIFVPMLFGIYYGQIVLAAVLTVFAPWSILVRLTLPPLWVSGEVFLAAVIAPGGPSPGEGLLFGGMTAFTWVLVQIPFWGTRRLLRVRLLDVDSHDASTPQGEQFSVGQMLIFTLVVAVLLGIGKALVSRGEVQDFFRIDADELMTFLLFVAAVVSSALVVIHVGLQPRPGPASRLAAVGLVIAIVVALRIALATGVVKGGPPDAYSILSNSVAGQAIWLALSLFGIRRGGWRLLRPAP